MYHPTTRVLTVLELLQARGRVSGPELAARLEVTTRTARRYITMLQDLGIPIEAERGRHGGYRLRPGFKLPPLMLTDDEALAVTLGLLVVRRMGLTASAPAGDGALAKIERVLPAPLREQVQAVQAALAVTVATSHAAATDVLVALSLAVCQGRRVYLRYGGWLRPETERLVDPYGLTFHEDRWYLSAYCHLRRDLRLFRLDRVVALEPRAERFTPPAAFDSRAFVVRSLATMPGIWQVVVLLHVDEARARRRVPPTHGTLVPVESGTLFRGTTDNLLEQARFLVGLGLPLTVLEPPELQAAMRELAGEVARMARRAASLPHASDVLS